MAAKNRGRFVPKLGMAERISFSSVCECIVQFLGAIWTCRLYIVISFCCVLFLDPGVLCGVSRVDSQHIF